MQVLAACLTLLGLCGIPIWELCIDAAALRRIGKGELRMTGYIVVAAKYNCSWLIVASSCQALPLLLQMRAWSRLD